MAYAVIFLWVNQASLSGLVNYFEVVQITKYDYQTICVNQLMVVVDMR